MTVVFEDEHLFAADKPGGLLTVPGRSPELADCLISRLQDARRGEGVFLVHRLDRDTSGLVLFAKTRDVQVELGRLFERREVAKTYRGLVQGRVRGDQGTVDAPLAKDWSRNNPPVYVVDGENGKAAITHWEVNSRGEEVTELNLRPQTGRSHQLRVHCQFLGRPLVGDPIYGSPYSSGGATLGKGWLQGAPGDASLCLRAVRLGFRHPVTEQIVNITVD